MAGDDGFIAPFELAMFTALLFTLLGVVSETLGVLHVRTELWRDTTQVARVVADSRDSNMFSPVDDTVTFVVSHSGGSCPAVTVRSERVYDGVVSRRAYVLRTQVTYPVTLYRTFSPPDPDGEPC